MTHFPQLLTRTAASLIASCIVSATAWAADDTARIRAIVDAAVRPVMSEHDVPGMAVAVTVGGKAYTFNYGLASREQNIPVTDATLFELGSVTKPMVATLATYAQALGKLSFDDHPSRYLPELKGSAIDKASLLHLGTYTAGGLPQQFPDKMGDAQMIGYFQKWQPNAAPGTQRFYSNPSLGLFGHLTALSLGVDFADAIEQQLFAPLGMKHSYVNVPDSAMSNYAWGYNEDNKPVRPRLGVLSGPMGGVRSTARDVLRLVQANIDPAQLQGPMRRAVESTHIGYFQVRGTVPGLGWEQYPYPVKLEQLVAGNSPEMSMDPNPARSIASPKAPDTETLFNKTGSTRGFGNYVVFVPKRKIGIVLLANKSLPAPARIALAHGLLEQLAPRTR